MGDSLLLCYAPQMPISRRFVDIIDCFEISQLGGTSVLEKVRFKLYKSGKKWVVAGIVFATVLTTLSPVMSGVSVLADEPAVTQQAKNSVQKGTIPPKSDDSIVNLKTVEDIGKWNSSEKVLGTDKEAPLGYRPGDPADPTEAIASEESTATHNGKVDNWQEFNKSDGVITTNRKNTVKVNDRDYTIDVNGRTYSYREGDTVDDNVNLDDPAYYGVNGLEDAKRARQMIDSTPDSKTLADNLKDTFPQYNFSGLRFPQEKIDKGLKYYIDPQLDDTMYQGTQIAIARINALGIVKLVETDKLHEAQLVYTNPYTKNGDGGYWFAETGAWSSGGVPNTMVIQADSNVMENGYGIDADDVDKAAGVLLHETGHALGFGHSDYANTVMNGTGGNTVETGIDALFISGLATLYGKTEGSVEQVRANKENINQDDVTEARRLAMVDAHNGKKQDVSTKSTEYQEAYNQSYEAMSKLIEALGKEQEAGKENAIKKEQVEARTQAIKDAIAGNKVDVSTKSDNYKNTYNEAYTAMSTIIDGLHKGQQDGLDRLEKKEASDGRTQGITDALAKNKQDVSDKSEAYKKGYSEAYKATSDLVNQLAIPNREQEAINGRLQAIKDALAKTTSDVSDKSTSFQVAYREAHKAMTDLINKLEQGQADGLHREATEARRQAIVDVIGGKEFPAEELEGKSQNYYDAYKSAYVAMGRLIELLQPTDKPVDPDDGNGNNKPVDPEQKPDEGDKTPEGDKDTDKPIVKPEDGNHSEQVDIDNKQPKPTPTPHKDTDNSTDKVTSQPVGENTADADTERDAEDIQTGVESLAMLGVVGAILMGGASLTYSKRKE